MRKFLLSFAFVGILISAAVAAPSFYEVSSTDTNYIKGMWATNQNSKMMIGLVQEKSQPPYLVVFDNASLKGNKAPVLAIILKKDGDADIQIRDKFSGVKYISLDNAINKLEKE